MKRKIKAREAAARVFEIEMLMFGSPISAEGAVFSVE